MRNDGFTHYYGRRKKDVIQKPVLQSEWKQFRIKGDLLGQYNRHKDWFDGNESEFIRHLISKGIEVMNQEEISDIG